MEVWNINAWDRDKGSLVILNLMILSVSLSLCLSLSVSLFLPLTLSLSVCVYVCVCFSLPPTVAEALSSNDPLVSMETPGSESLVALQCTGNAT